MRISRIVVSTLGQIVVILVIDTLFSKFGIFGTVGNKFNIARRSRNTTCIRLWPNGSNESCIPGSARIGRIGSSRWIILATQEIATVIYSTKGSSYSGSVIDSSSCVCGVPSHSENFSHTNKLGRFIVGHCLLTWKSLERSSKIWTTSLCRHNIYVVKRNIVVFTKKIGFISCS